MENQMKLPIRDPLLTSHSEHAYIFAMIPKMSEASIWVFKNYMLLEFSNNEDTGLYTIDFSPNRYDRFTRCPFVLQHVIYEDFALKKWGDIISFLINCITYGYYVVIELNEFYIPAYDNYQKRQQYHPALIYGYDKNSKIFYACDNFQNRKFRNETISFEDIEKGYLYDQFCCVKLLKATSDVFSEQHPLFLKTVIDNINTYTSTYHKDFKFVTQCSFKEESYQGIEVYRKVSLVLNRIENDDGYIGVRDLWVIYDHKKILCLLMEYIRDTYLILNIGIYLKEIEDIKINSKILVNLLIKYNITNNKSILRKMNKILENIYNHEYRLLTNLKDDLKPLLILLCHITVDFIRMIHI